MNKGILERCQQVHDMGLGPQCHAQCLIDLSAANGRVKELERENARIRKALDMARHELEQIRINVAGLNAPMMDGFYRDNVMHCATTALGAIRTASEGK